MNIAINAFANEDLANCSMGARVLALGMHLLSDDEGQLISHPLYLRSRIFPYDDISLADMRKWLDELENNQIIANREEDFLTIFRLGE